jgi:methanogenic corrinoid protein MtbC1
MKKLLLLFVLTFTAGAYAQSKEDVAIIQAVYGKSKADLVKQYLNLNEVQTAAFQPVYDKYEIERKKLGQKKIEIINDYAVNYATLDDVKAAELTQANLKNNLDLEKLLSATFEKVKKAIGGINAAKFVQLEQYLQVTVRAEIQDSIPFIDEIDKTKITQ